MQIALKILKMKVTITGHSYVRELEGLGIRYSRVQGHPVEFQYIHRGGASYESHLRGRDHHLFEKIRNTAPDVIIVILAGNSLTSGNTDIEILAQSDEYFKTLRWFAPNSLIVAAQIELRFYRPGNRFGSPLIEEYTRRRLYLNREIQKCQYVDSSLTIEGNMLLDKRSLYRSDGVHLKRQGYEKYLNIIKSYLGSIILESNVLEDQR